MIHEFVALVVARFWPLFVVAAAVDLATWAIAAALSARLGAWRHRRRHRFLVGLPPPGSH